MAKPRRVARSARVERAEGSIREDRTARDRDVTENRDLTDSERLDAFRNSFFQSALPDLPKIPGWHVCWLTTTNPRDPIHARIRLGYQPILGSDIPGWEHATIKTGEYAGMIGVNEMLAFKLPIRLYERYMGYAHHEAPRQEEEKIAATADMIREQAASQTKSGMAPLIPFEGNEELEEEVPEAPLFSEATGEA